MMKRSINLLIIICISLLVGIRPVFATANTLGDLKNELAKLRSEKAANESAKNKTKEEIRQENVNIANANAEVEKAESDIAQSKAEIEQSNNAIAKTKNETEKLLEFYQIMQGNDNFSQYFSESSSVTDLVMRMEAISQIVNYNQEKLKKLEELIKTNEGLQVELAKKEIQLEKNIESYNQSIASLNNDLSNLLEVSLDIDSQITAQQKLIKYYENIGCKDDQQLSVCVAVANSASWLKPVDSGYVSSGFGYRSFYLNGKPYSDYHPANDIAGNAGGTNVYAAANGTVAAVIYKASCGGNQVYIHVRVQGVAYTLTYAHLMGVNVKVGDSVTQQTVIGTVGGGGSTLKVNGGWDTCSTGYHLHFGVTKGFYLGGGAEGYSSYSKYISNSIQPPMLPKYGVRFYTRY